MEAFLIKTLQLILCFALLILLHEGGHFFFAKLFKVRVEKFCLFFDPWKSWKIFSFRGTDYHIGWLPLGGYVKISGMIDESMDVEQMKQPVQPWEFRAKPAWQRLLIMVGGVLVNFLLALFIYAMILFAWGDTYVPIEKMNEGFKYNEQAHKLGFRDGDIPLRTDEKTFERYSVDIYRDLSEAHSVTVLRQGKEMTFALPGDLDMLKMLKAQPPFIAPLATAVIDSVAAGSPAERAGIKAGDRLLALNGTELETWNEFDLQMSDINSSLKTYREDNNKTMTDSLSRVTMVVQHAAGPAVPDTLSLVLDEQGKAGFFKHLPFADYPKKTRTYGFFESFPAGCAHGWDVLCGYVDDLKYLFTADGAQSLGSFGTIGSLFPAQWDWLRFWELTAFISLMLAFVNILPIPALDGGHVLFLLYEVITRRKPSDRFLEIAQTIGMWLLFALMAYAIFNDLLRFVF
ncbi:MAG: RIP metalloprotease RseP [Bacteroidaceae bacterium]|nr:RIP metalloprotease RseP [Bacteroidaceae bacterium]